MVYFESLHLYLLHIVIHLITLIDIQVRDAGFHSQETVIYIAASQLIRHPFILRDIDSLLGRGEVPGLFSTKEKNELNEV